MTFLRLSILTFFIFFSSICFSQSTLKHRKGASGFSIGVVNTKNADGYQLGGRFLLSPFLEYNIQASYFIGTVGFVDYSNFIFDNTISYNVANICKFMYFYINGGCGIGFQSLQSSVEPNGYQEGLVFNAMLGIKLYTYIYDNIFLYGEAQQHLGYNKLNDYYAQFNLGIGYLIPNKRIKKVHNNQ